jgi:hypothetical protein
MACKASELSDLKLIMFMVDGSIIPASFNTFRRLGDNVFKGHTCIDMGSAAWRLGMSFHHDGAPTHIG